jgi:DNA-binding helix-hairpin-helix protein with protein kinase domain
MSRIDAREDLHELYNPKSRRRAFPDADFRFLVRVATNLARAFAQVHAHGNVIGDVNHGNALVGRDGTVVLIDCDSFQVRHGGRTFTCDVGVPLFTPPELSGRAYRGLARSANHDAFGLAVLLFHLLFMGRHPFAGRFADGEMPIERAIAESRFVYGAQAGAHRMSVPPGTLPLNAFGDKVAASFEAAFAAPGDVPRPTATHWASALQELETELAACDAPSPHWHPRGSPRCCWCEHEQRTGMQVFGRVVSGAVSAGAAQVARLWDLITAIPRPEPQPPAEALSPPAYHYKASDALGSSARLWLGIGSLLGSLLAVAMQPGGTRWSALFYVGVAIACGWPSARRLFRDRAAAELVAFEARARVEELTRQWNRLSNDVRFERLLQDLADARKRLVELPDLRTASLKTLAEQAAKLQKDRFLSLFRVQKARLPRLTPSDVVMLESHGIDSADDVLRHAAELPRLVGADNALDLEAWATHQEKSFKFDARNGADPADVREIDRLIQAQQEQYLGVLQQGAHELQTLRLDIEQERGKTRRQLEAARSALAVAEKELA